jgi:hypothetical protein
VLSIDKIVADAARKRQLRFMGSASMLTEERQKENIPGRRRFDKLCDTVRCDGSEQLDMGMHNLTY